VLNQVVDIHVFREIGHNLFNLLFLHLIPFSKVDRELSLCSPIRRNRPVASYQRHPIKDCVAIHDIFQNSNGPKKIWSGESHACNSQLFS
jgi:hypothetical protein